MRKNHFYPILILGLSLASCTKTELESSTIKSMVDEPGTSYSITLEDDLDQELPLTKAYFEQNGTKWNYVWEDGDKIGVFQYRGRQLISNPGAEVEVDKRPDETVVLYNASEFRAGDAIYAYLKQPEAESEFSTVGIENDDPHNLYVMIPTFQESSNDPEIFEFTRNNSFEIGTISKSGLGISKKDLTSIPRDNYPVPSGTLKFKIINYNRNLRYICDNDPNFTVDYYGNATIHLSPAPVNPSGFTVINAGSNYKTEYTRTYEYNISIDGYEGTPANITVTEKFSFNAIKSGSKMYSGKFTATYNCDPENADYCEDVTLFGDEKPYPIRNCMPLVSKQYNVTTSAMRETIEGLTDFTVVPLQSHMTMYNLGSVIEFKLYVTDEDSEALGDNIFAAILSTDENCAGVGYVDLVSEDLELNGMTESEIIATDVEKTVELGQERYKSFYMVVAPGTYNGTVQFLSETKIYTIDLGSKTYERNKKKGILCDLSADYCEIETVVPGDDEGGDDEGGEDGGDDDDENPDTPEQPQEPDYGVNLGEFNLLNSTMQSYFTQAEATYNDSNYKTVSVFNTSSFPRGGGGDLYDNGNHVTSYYNPAPVTIPLNGYNGQNVSVSVYTDAEKLNVAATVSGNVQNNAFEVYNLIPGKTYWYTATVNGTTASYGYFNTVGQRRIIKVSDTVYADNANNCRDLGGQVTSDGKTLKYGKIFRGTNMDATTASEKAYLTNDLNIRLDVDLRADSHNLTRNQAKAALDQSIVTWNHENISGRSDLESGKDSNNNYKIANIFNAIVETLEDGGAVYIHCFAGADRTGYVCMLLEAVCGVSLSDCTIDYELTSFSCVGVRDRCGKLKSGSDILNNISFINNKSGANYKAKAEQVLRSSGVSEEQIAKFRNLMIE